MKRNNRFVSQYFRVLVCLLAIAVSGCASTNKKSSFIPNTTVPADSFNRGVIKAVEAYRRAVEAQDVAALLILASPDYQEDGGTSSGRDDYNYDKLKEVMTKRFARARDVRYALRYVAVENRCPSKKGGVPCRAAVDVLVDASYTIDDGAGEERRVDMRDQNQLILEWHRDRWLFLSGY